jgi:hypothetical protein
VQGILNIVNWLDVGNTTAHGRWRPVPARATYCNIYVYDVCEIAGLYVPRVWWTASAIADLRAGRSIRPIYGNTVNELNANALFDWFSEFGADFGWEQVFDVQTLQSAANRGSLGVIVAKRRVLSESGHIQVIVPENGLHRAVRNARNEVTLPLQSQAGARNFNYGQLGNRQWWTASQFRSFSLWRSSL